MEKGLIIERKKKRGRNEKVVFLRKIIAYLKRQKKRTFIMRIINLLLTFFSLS